MQGRRWWCLTVSVGLVGHARSTLYRLAWLHAVAAAAVAPAAAAGCQGQVVI
jgi:hypothetical protein